MKTLNDIHNEWSKDSIIDSSRLNEEALKIPKLHAKYLRYLSAFRLQYRRKVENRRKVEEKLKDYFTGKINGPDIGREPWELTETKGSVEKRISADNEMIQCNFAIIEEEEKVKALTEIINNLNQRNFQLKVAVDYLRFTQGSI